MSRLPAKGFRQFVCRYSNIGGLKLIEEPLKGISTVAQRILVLCWYLVYCLVSSASDSLPSYGINHLPKCICKVERLNERVQVASRTLILEPNEAGLRLGIVILEVVP